MEKVGRPSWVWFAWITLGALTLSSVFSVLMDMRHTQRLNDQATIIEAQRVRASLLEARVSSLVGSIDAMRADARARDGL